MRALARYLELLILADHIHEFFVPNWICALVLDFGFFLCCSLRVWLQVELHICTSNLVAFVDDSEVLSLSNVDTKLMA